MWTLVGNTFIMISSLWVAGCSNGSVQNIRNSLQVFVVTQWSNDMLTETKSVILYSVFSVMFKYYPLATHSTDQLWTEQDNDFAIRTWNGTRAKLAHCVVIEQCSYPHENMSIYLSGNP